jgi:hypothetical protein
MCEQGFLPKRRAENCRYEFQTFDHASKAVMDMTWFPPPGAKAPRN